jgi:hypothetical protein
MVQPEIRHVDFEQVVGRLQLSQFWEYDCGSKRRTANVPQAAFAALQAPLDFPPMSAAIVPGDRVALAVDPNIPQLAEVIRGVLQAIAATDAGAADIVLWDEATDQTIASLREEVGEAASVSRHRADLRSELRYLAADQAGDPVYVDRLVVDADFVLPIISQRAMDRVCGHDLTGVYPSLTDSATRYRHHLQMSKPETEINERCEDQIPWLLGVNLIMTVTPNASGSAAEIMAGTPEAIGKQVTPVRRAPDEYPPPASLVIASLDGDAQQQTWQNAARAVVAASRYVQPGGTIVLWTEIDCQPSGLLASLDEVDPAADEPALGTSVDQDGNFPEWHPTDLLAAAFARIAAEYRVLLHSRIAGETIESMGLGVVETEAELDHLCRSFDSCGVLRAAQFAGSTLDAPHRQGIETE